MKITKIATSWFDPSRDRVPRGFDSVDVRRLMGIFSDFQDWAKSAEGEMEQWLENKEYDITFEEAKSRLSYYLNQLGLND